MMLDSECSIGWRTIWVNLETYKSRYTEEREVKFWPRGNLYFVALNDFSPWKWKCVFNPYGGPGVWMFGIMKTLSLPRCGSHPRQQLTGQLKECNLPFLPFRHKDSLIWGHLCEEISAWHGETTGSLIPASTSCGVPWLVRFIHRVFQSFWFVAIG